MNNEFYWLALIIISLISTTIMGIKVSKLRQEIKQLKVYVVYNECAVFTSTDFSGIKFNHEKPPILPDSK